jgi:hypothetical protein
MTVRRQLVEAVLWVVLAAVPLVAQTANTPVTEPNSPSARQWSFSMSATCYIVPHGGSYVSPVITADRNQLHLEARYNYEAIQTGSLWVGRSFSIGSKLTLEVTPMIGGVVGTLKGLAPGYNASLSYKRIVLSTQGEYFIAPANRSDNFFYSWMEATYSPAEWLRAGFVAQRTKAYETDLDVQRGVLVGFSKKRLDFTAYVLNAGWTDPTVVLTISMKF